MKIIALQIKIIVLAICFLGASNTATTQTVHAIICGATNVTDIGDGCKVSVNKLENALKYVEQQTKMDVKITRLTGSNFSKPRIVQAINKLKADENDVIMFYSTSHGFNYKDIPSRYAIISAHPTKVEMSRRELVNFGLSLEKEVYQPLLRKGARLTIAMAEACNTVVDIPSPSSYNAMNINIQKRLKELFLQAKGSVISSSSEIDQRSWTDPQDGGIYTNMFIKSMNEVISSNQTATWEAVFDKTDNYTRTYAANEKIRGGQNPQHEVNLIDTAIKVIDDETEGEPTQKKTKKHDYIAPKVRVKKEEE